MKTVAIYLSLPKETGGIFQWARTVLHALSNARDRDVRVIAVSPPGTEWEPICRDFGVEWREIGTITPAERVLGKLIRVSGFSGPWARHAMSRVTPLGRVLESMDADLCIYTDSEHFSYELATPSVIPIHDLMHHFESRFEENRAFKDPDGLLQRICDGSRAILVDSEVGRHHVEQLYGPCGAEIFALPYIPPDYVYDESILPPDPQLPGLLDSLPDKFLFYPAQFWEHKNHIRLIDAVMGAAVHHPDIHLVLAGSPKNNYERVISHIEQRCAQSHVSLVGYVSDRAKMELYRRARALVMPTFYGPTNIPPLEAFELGCAVATSGIYGVPEQLGDAAILFDPESVEQIQDAVERLWSDDELLDDLVARGREHAKSWGPTQFATRLWAIVEALLAEKR